MDWTQYIMPAATLVSAFAAVLAWYSKLRWSAEYKAATEQIIASKDANIALLRDQVELWKSLNSKSIYEQYQAVKNMLDETVKKFTVEIAERDEKIHKFSASSEQQSEKLAALTADRDKLKELKEAAEIRLEVLKAPNEIKTLFADMEKYVTLYVNLPIDTSGAALTSSPSLTSDDEGGR